VSPSPPPSRTFETLGLILLSSGLLALGDWLTGAGSNRHLQVLVGVAALPLAIGLTLTGAFLVWRRPLMALLGSHWYAELLLGLVLFLLMLATAAHLPYPAGEAYAVAQAGRGGGLVGWALSEVMRQALGSVPAWIVTLATGMLGLALMVLYSPLRLLDPTALWAFIRKRRATGAPPKPPSPVSSAPSPEPTPPSPPAVAKAVARSGRSPRTTPSPPSAPATPAVPTPPPRRALRRLPPLDLLSSEDRIGNRNEQAAIQASIIEQTLAGFGIPARVVETHIGPTVTRFALAPGELRRHDRTVRVRVSQITALADDLALALAASPVRIEAPVPGRPYIGIEVPNPDTTLVSLRRLLQDKAFTRYEGVMPIPLGRDVGGAAVVVDLHRLPHLLIAGATGSGKSVALHAILCALLFHHPPDTLRFILVDPKRVELPVYNGIPHLVAPVITEAEHAAAAMSWLLLEMDERYRRFSATGARHILAYNAAVHPSQRLPFLVMIVDELADLMVTAPETIEARLVRLAQMARATGIHLIVATQRPSVDVVTGLIKANFPARLAFAVASQIDSRVILDGPGAEKLLGRGDGLLMTADSAKPRRIQGCFVSDAEIARLVDWWRTNHPAPPSEAGAAIPPWSHLLEEDGDGDALLQQAIAKLRTRQTITTSGLQRLLGIGYPRAARLMEELEAAGIVGPETDRRSGRRVLLSEDEESTAGDG
jgi:S-DNA-T family DNA segregation ATPase FtsK/SpoIIIE